MAAKKRQRTRKAKPGPKRSAGAIEAIERDLARAALQKRQRGETPSREEVRALRRVERARREELAWEIYAAIPKGHWVEMSGRQHRTINEQAARYAIPFGGRTISLPDVVRALHDFLAENAPRLAAGDEDPMLAGSTSPALERFREERAKLARLDRLEREGKLLARDKVHDGLARIATILRGAGDTLQRQFGPDALELLNDALDDAQREIVALIDQHDDRNTEPAG